MCTPLIYIDTAFGRLPFTRQGDFGAESGFGVSVWGGGEYQRRQSGYERLKLRLGADTALREYPGGDFLDGPVVDFTAVFAWTPAPGRCT